MHGLEDDLEPPVAVEVAGHRHRRRVRGAVGVELRVPERLAVAGEGEEHGDADLLGAHVLAPGALDGDDEVLPPVRIEIGDQRARGADRLVPFGGRERHVQGPQPDLAVGLEDPDGRRRVPCPGRTSRRRGSRARGRSSAWMAAVCASPSQSGEGTGKERTICPARRKVEVKPLVSRPSVCQSQSCSPSRSWALIPRTTSSRPSRSRSSASGSERMPVSGPP